jgi:O-succinylbenzoic acid--CoA ligase
VGEVPDALRERLQHISTQVFETYGMTETISHIALKKINGDGASAYFTTLDGVAIRQDDRGCSIISAPNLFGDES